MASFEHQEELVVGLWDRGVLRCASNGEGYVRLTTGRMSPHWADFEALMSVDKTRLPDMALSRQLRVRELAVQATAATVSEAMQGVDHMTAVTRSVTQFSGAVAMEAGVSCVNVRVPEFEAAADTLHMPIEGSHERSDTVLGLAFDDTSIRTVSNNFFLSIVAAELHMRKFAVLLDRQEGSREKFAESGQSLAAVIGMNEAVDMLRANERLSDRQLGFIQDYTAHYGEL